jgi:hypothetical protein
MLLIQGELVRVMVSDAWDSYRESVMPANAGETQRSECQKAFYAGAWSILMTVQAIGEPDVSEKDGMRILDGLIKECRAFAKLQGFSG